MYTILGAGTARDPISKTDPLEHVLWGLLKIYSIWSRSDVFLCGIHLESWNPHEPPNPRNFNLNGGEMSTNVPLNQDGDA